MIAAFIIQFLGFGCLLAAALVKLYRVTVELEQAREQLLTSLESHGQTHQRLIAVCENISWDRAYRIIDEAGLNTYEDADEVLLEERV